MAAKRQVQGFTLIELMVALVVGLIVTLAAVGFVVSVAKANSENIRVTRLTQEMRSLSEVMSREIRRARYVRDPIGNVNRSGIPVNLTALVEVPDPVARDCIRLEYQLPPDPDDGPGEPPSSEQRSIYLVNGTVYISPDLLCKASTGGVAVSTPEVSIDVLEFDFDGAFRVDQRIAGKLASGTADLTSINREFRQTVFIRSGQVN